MQVDVLVIGAGPAGLAAAELLAARGVKTLVVDEGSAPGGQIYRAVEANSVQAPERLRKLGAEYAHGLDLVRAFRASNAGYMAQTTVWQLTKQRSAYLTRAGQTQKINARRVIVASGAMERPVPIPGWTLPGVTTIGALQINLKQSGLVHRQRLALVGSGPLLYLFASQLLAIGMPPVAVIDTGSPKRWVRLGGLLVRALAGGGFPYVRKGVGLLAQLRASGVPWYTGSRNLRIDAADVGLVVRFECGSGKVQFAVDHIGLHEGLIPAQHLLRQVGCTFVWDEAQAAHCPRINAWGQTSIPGIAVAGDGAAIGGAVAAEHGGRIAAVDAAFMLGVISPRERDKLARAPLFALARQRAVRPLLDAMFAPSSEVLRPSGDTIVCRCEGVHAQAVIAEAQTVIAPMDHLKRKLRCGMGPCQGRICGPIVSQLISQARNAGSAEAGYYHVRAPLAPLALQELANLPQEGAEA